VHPFFAQRQRLAIYVVAWLLAGVALAEALRRAVPQPAPFAHAMAVPTTLLLGFAVLSAWWVCRANPLVEDRLGSAALAQGGAALQVGALWTAATAAWGVAITRLSPHPGALEAVRAEWPLLFAVSVPAYLLSAIVHYLAIAFEASHDAERRVLESEVTAREAELRALRAQLNPHFLFNSLNSINALVGSDPEGARRMCEGLGDFLRRTLALGARDDVALSEELELVDRYLSIEQVRFGARLKVERDIAPGAAACRVPPLLLQPLVENAVKHGFAGRLDGGTIRLVARRNGDALVLEVHNPVDEDAPARPGAGLGLENVRRRLEAFGSRGARLDAVRGASDFVVMLVLPAIAGGGEEA
jgi:two-component system sensor histidine kinase AlgZ